MSRRQRSARRREEEQGLPGRQHVRLEFRCKSHPQIRIATVGQDDDDEELWSEPADHGHRDPSSGALFFYVECPKCALPTTWTEQALRRKIAETRAAGKRTARVFSQ